MTDPTAVRLARLQRRQTWLMAATALSLVVAAGSVWRTERLRQPDPVVGVGPGGLLRAEGLAIKDAQDRTRCVLKSTPGGSALLMLGEDGTVRASLYAGPDRTYLRLGHGPNTIDLQAGPGGQFQVLGEDGTLLWEARKRR